MARVVAGRYRLLGELGRGGMGVVWLAEDELVGRRVAVKELRPPGELAGDERETFSRRALAEARSAARVHHPGAVTLFDVLPASGGDDAVYLIMELVEGPTLAQLIERDGPLPAPVVAGYGLQLLSVLAVAHQLGVVHRDIKPANIMIAAGGQAKLADFGIAHTVGDPRLTRSGFMGTQAYTAPELFDAAPLTPAADVWSLGATLFAAAQGQGPFDRDTTGATLRAIVVDPVPVPACPPLLAAAITGMLQRDPARRASLDQSRAALLQAATSAGQAGQPRPLTDQVTAHLTPGAAAGQGAGPLGGWDQGATTRSPSAPPAVHRALQAPAQRRPASSRRSLLIITAAAAAVIVAAAIVIPIVLHATSQPTLAATLANPAGSSGNAEVTSVAFSPDGKTLASGDFDGGVYLWDTATRRIVLTLTDPGTTSSMSSVAFSPDGTMLATGGQDAYLWNLNSHALAGILNDPATASGGTSAGVNAVAFSPDSKTLAAADGDDSTYLWDVATRKVIATVTDPSGFSSQMKAVAFSPDGAVLATGDGDGSIYLWNVATGRLAATLADPGGQGVASVAFSPNGRMLAACDLTGHAYLWKVATRRLAATLSGPPGSLNTDAVAFSPDGTMVTVADSDGSTYLFEVATGRVTATLTDPNATASSGEGVTAVAFSPDGKLLASGDADNSTYVWSIG